MERDLTGLKTDDLVFAHGSAEMTMRIGETLDLALNAFLHGRMRES